MKVIDLLVKMASGEEMPIIIRYQGYNYKYNEIDKDYQKNDGLMLLGNMRVNYCLQDEIIIIEEKKEKEKICQSITTIGNLKIEGITLTYSNGLFENQKEELEEIEKIQYYYKNTYGNISQHKKSEINIIDKINELIENQNKIIREVNANR